MQDRQKGLCPLGAGLGRVPAVNEGKGEKGGEGGERNKRCSRTSRADWSERKSFVICLGFDVAGVAAGMLRVLHEGG